MSDLSPLWVGARCQGTQDPSKCNGRGSCVNCVGRKTGDHIWYGWYHWSVLYFGLASCLPWWTAVRTCEDMIPSPNYMEANIWLSASMLGAPGLWMERLSGHVLVGRSRSRSLMRMFISVYMLYYVTNFIVTGALLHIRQTIARYPSLAEWVPFLMLNTTYTYTPKHRTSTQERRARQAVSMHSI